MNRLFQYKCAAFYKLLSLLIAVPLAISFSLSAHAEIYKYRNSDGSWRFSDQPPNEANQAEAVKQSKATTNTKTRSANNTNLKHQLFDKYQPNNKIESATLSVVKIETPLGTGSGFIISEDGYLVTNKHVVRPPAQTINKAETNLEKQAAWLERRKDHIDSRYSSLKSHKKNLKEYTEYYNGLSDSEQAREKTELKRRRSQYSTAKKDTERYNREYKKRLSEYQSRKSTYDSKRHSAMLAQHFTAVMKNSTRLPATLVLLSDKYDLALLKIDGYTLPALQLAKDKNIRQTDKVYAIGSPLGKRDYVTAGIVTSLRKDKIIMDAQILPGNSGGPLLNEASEVIGVNTWKQMTTPGSIVDGFGIAIPVAIVEREFGGYLQEEDGSRGAEVGGGVVNDPDLMKSILEGFREEGG